jgi:hypothetical protein
MNGDGSIGGEFFAGADRGEYLLDGRDAAEEGLGARPAVPPGKAQLLSPAKLFPGPFRLVEAQVRDARQIEIFGGGLPDRAEDPHRFPPSRTIDRGFQGAIRRSLWKRLPVDGAARGEGQKKESCGHWSGDAPGPEGRRPGRDQSLHRGRWATI